MPGTVVPGFGLGPSPLAAAGEGVSQFAKVLNQLRLEQIANEKERRLREAAAFPTLLKLAEEVRPGARPTEDVMTQTPLQTRSVSGLLPLDSAPHEAAGPLPLDLSPEESTVSTAAGTAEPAEISKAVEGVVPTESATSSTSPAISVGPSSLTSLFQKTTRPVSPSTKTVNIPQDLQGVLGKTLDVPVRYESDLPGNVTITPDLISKMDPLHQAYFQGQVGRVMPYKDLPEPVKPLVAAEGASVFEPPTVAHPSGRTLFTGPSKDKPVDFPDEEWVDPFFRGKHFEVGDPGYSFAKEAQARILSGHIPTAGEQLGLKSVIDNTTKQATFKTDAEIRAGGTRFSPMPTQTMISLNPENIDATANLIGTYAMPPRDLGMMANKSTVMARVHQLYPDFDETNYNARNATRTKFTAGSVGDNITALNTAVDHVGLLNELFTALKTPTNIRPINDIVNRIADTLGNPDITNAQQAVTAVSSELASLLRKGRVSDEAVNEWEKNISPNMSPAQGSGAIGTVLRLMRGRERGLQHQWQTAFGMKSVFPLYGPEQEQILKSLGYKPMTQAGGAAAAVPAVPSGGTDAAQAVIDKFVSKTPTPAEQQD